MLRRSVIVGLFLSLLPAWFVIPASAGEQPAAERASAPALARAAAPKAAPEAEEAPAAKRPKGKKATGKKGSRRYRATVRRTRHGIPHIRAKDWGSLGFGSGYAAAETNLCTLADTLVTARGERSRWHGPKGRYSDEVTLEASNLQVDALVTDLHHRKVVETLLADKKAGPTRQARAMMRGYAAGINKFVRTAKPRQLRDPGCRGAGYLKHRATELDLWYGVYLANMLASTGVFLPKIVDADPPSLTDPGLPNLPLPLLEDLDVPGILKGLGKDPELPFGSNATAIGGDLSANQRGMVLGNPHFPWRGRYRFSQQHLTIPGRYDVAGASLIGSPIVNIGWNKDVAWSHTVSTGYRFTPYEYVALGPTTYLTEQGPQQLERREVTIEVKRRDGSIGTVTEDLYRTNEGYVIDDPDQLMPWGVATLWAIRDANAEHLRTIDSFHAMAKAKDVRDLLRKQDWGGGIPWVNTIAADRHGETLYADHSVVPHVSDAMASRCMTAVGRLLHQVAGLPGLDGTRAQSSCRWGTDADAQRPGVFGSASLPDLLSRRWVGNANDSYWTPNAGQRLEGFARIIGCERCSRTFRTQMVYRYVQEAEAAGRRITPAMLRGFQHANRQRVAELARAGGDLDAVCQAAGDAQACAVLSAWDGRSDTTSRGTHLFAEFVDRLPASAWAVPFDATDPMNTPRDLQEKDAGVITAFREAVASLRERRIPLDATWGSLQVAGDRGAPAIAIGGGDHATGNANAISADKPVRNADRYRAVTYGSSHIQAVSFSRRSAKPFTILTYGQSEDPRSRWSWDQTRRFGRERWVRFPFRAKHVRKQAKSTVTVQGKR